MSQAELTPHSVLARQLRRLNLSDSQPPNAGEWRSLLTRVSAAYADADQQRYLAERSLQVSLEEMHDLNADLLAARMRLETVFDSASVGLCVLDADGVIESVNPGATAALGVQERDLIGSALWAAMSVRAEPNGILLDQQNFELTAEAAQPWHINEALITCANRTFSASCVLTPLAGEGERRSGAVLMIVDITARKKAQADLAWRARNDALTGLVNRDTLVERISAALEGMEPVREQAAVIFIDLDRFKAVNDTLGHAAGDELLTVVAARLSLAVRSTDVVGRWAGDEFVIFCRPVARSEAVSVSQRVIDDLERPFLIDGREVHISASIGVAIGRPESTASTMVAEADAAMYEAKQAGRGVIRVFDDDSRRVTTRRLHLERSLRDAINQSQLGVAFQPQLDLTSGKLVGFELLTRWTMADGSSVSPAEFIPIAEDTGLIHDLGWQILEASATSITTWAGAVPDLSLAVNISSRQLQRPGFIERLRDLINHHGIHPGSLTIEITESVLLDDPEAALAHLRRIRDLGVRLAIDDFGTGYSSLSYLRRLPIDDVKIDREFIVDLTSSASGRTIVDAVVQMCHALGYRVIAEGVETVGQAELLRTLGCDIGQGFIFGRPTGQNHAKALVDPTNLVARPLLGLPGPRGH
jgi:diguanylate cyclase (GGDEF)-like protein/PAS domain S-box-containing protein